MIKKYGVHPAHIRSLAKGILKTHDGWKIYGRKETRRGEIVKIKNIITGEIDNGTVMHLSEKHNLEQCNLYAVCCGKRNHHLNWVRVYNESKIN
jgi:hypothetical protein